MESVTESSALTVNIILLSRAYCLYGEYTNGTVEKSVNYQYYLNGYLSVHFGTERLSAISVHSMSTIS